MRTAPGQSDALPDYRLCDTQCEHHLLPFYGMAHIAYLPAEGGTAQPLTLAQLEAIVAMYSKRLQIQVRTWHPSCLKRKTLDLDGCCKQCLLRALERCRGSI